MSLFKKSNEKPAAAPAPQSVPSGTVIKTPETATINLTDKMLRVEMLTDETTIKYGYLDQNGENIRIISGSDILIAEVSKRSKAYAELESKLNKRMQYIVIKAKQGDYGVYYQAKIIFEDSVTVII